MQKPVGLILLLFILSNTLWSQGIQDSVFNINEVTVSTQQIFNKEIAGMTETHVDSLFLIEKINLSLSEVLSENTPVFIKNHGRGALATASFRGTAASHTQVSWNGIDITSPMAGMVDFSLIPIYVIDEMKLQHGAASISQQSGGLGGSIKLKNTVDWNNNFSGRFLQGIGSYKTYNSFFQVNTGNKKWQSKTRIYHNYSKNNFTFINRSIANIDSISGEISNPLDTNKQADYRIYGLLQEVYFTPSPENVFSLKYWGQHAFRSIPRITSYEGPEYSMLNRQTDVDHKVLASWVHFNKHSQLTFRTAYSGKNLIYSLMNHVSGYGSMPTIYSTGIQHSSLNFLEYKYNISSSFSAKASFNANYHKVISRDTVSQNGYNKNRSDYSLLISAQKNFANRLNLNCIIRQELINNKFAPIIPYLGLDYKILPNKNLIFKANIARNFHYPSLNDMYWQPGGNPELLPEQGITYETGIEYQIISNQSLLHFGANIYQSKIDNWIIWIPSFKGYWEAQNIKMVVSKGVEANTQISGKYGNIKYQFGGSYSYTSSVNYGDTLVWGSESYGKQLVFIPLHSGNLQIYLNYKGYYISYQHNAYSQRFSTSNNDITQRDWMYPYFMNDIIIGKEIKLKKVSLSAEFKIYNLLNETYHSILYQPMPKRNYLLILMVNF